EYYKKQSEKQLTEKDFKRLGEEDGPGKIKELKLPQTIDVEELVGNRNLVLLRGGAGMGKTTLIKHLAYTIVHNTCQPSLKGYLPVMIFLKDLWMIYNETLEKNKKKKIVFEELLTLYLEKIKCKLTMEVVSDFLAGDRVLFLMDGLDEVPKHLRSDLVEMMAQFQFAHKENRFLLTGRSHGIDGKVVARFGDDLQDIIPLDDQKVNGFITRWFKAVSGRASGLGEATAEGMMADIREHEHISLFTGNPLLLTAVCILYQDGKRIPDQRADLYNRIIENLISRRFHDPGQPEKENEVLEFLMHLAFESQQKKRKSIEREEAAALLKETIPPKEGELEPRYHRRIRELFNEVEPGCGLFNRLGSDQIQFTHLTFQEFLAAKYMVYMNIDFTDFLEHEWWQETLLLYAGFMSLDRKKQANDIVASILDFKTKSRKMRGELPLLGARALLDFQASKRDGQTIRHTREQLYRVMNTDAVLDRRFRAGVLVGGLGDTRISHDNMVKIPEGEFIRGSNDGEDIERPQRQIFLDAFMMGVYPVTNQEFKSFVEEQGYQREEFWEPEGWKWRCENNITEPGSWPDRQWNGANFPVVNVSWYEAAAYADWLSRETGMSYRLPTEAEWEKAARGPGGNVYPWGKKFNKDYCNSRESGLKRTSPVGIFPKGKSVYDCFDMSGNVWEWCADWGSEGYYKESPSRNPKGPSAGSFRVLRGGGWFGSSLDCRAACRFWGPPSNRLDFVGFRLVRSF
ncbi:MAG: SUMF1/EgtB/PvdO family nonheme iron enzyme, partial [bacterium]|nr:SUMF1/EgtB/PvdO family nonheme iron enzyme [bacterium]